MRRKKHFIVCSLAIIILFSCYTIENTTTVNIESVDGSNSREPSRPSLALISHEPITILNDSAFSSYGFPGIGTEVDPYRIENYSIETTEENGIYINQTSVYFLIENCYVDAQSYGIYISYSGDGKVKVINNTCINNNEHGIVMEWSSGSTLTNNTCTNNNWYGIYLRYSSGSTLTNNTCTNNSRYGIHLEITSNISLISNICFDNNFGIYLGWSSGSTLTNNTCTNNYYDGIHLDESSNSTLTNNTCSNNNGYGIYLYYYSISTLTNNTCNNNNYGIYLLLSSNISIINNTCNSNDEYGVYAGTSSNYNIIHHNMFIYNSQSPQAYDDGSNNTWYDISTNGGNYWSDYYDSGNYSIAGSADSVDPYPLTLDADGDSMPDWWELTNGLDPSIDDSAADPDNDNLSNLDEYTNGTDPQDSDTDNDSMDDLWEVTYGLDPLLNDADEDLDDDGLTNLEEYQNQTEPNDADSDNDGMPDGWEVTNSLNPLVNDADSDADTDNLSNLDEYSNGTNPQDYDSDHDGLDDGAEVNVYYTNPLDADSDDDGLTDGAEVNTYFTNPTSNDTDSDGLLDGVEVNTYETDPNNSDTDADGLTDGAEVKLHLTNPLDSDSDGDGLDDYDEIMTYATDPNNKDTDGDGRSDRWEINNNKNPLVADYYLQLHEIIIYFVIIPISLVLLIVGIVCLRRLRTGKALKLFFGRQSVKLSNLEKETNYSLTDSRVNLSLVFDKLLPIISPLSEEISSNKNANRFRKLFNKRWVKRKKVYAQISSLVTSVGKSFNALLDKLSLNDLSEITSDIDQKLESLEGLDSLSSQINSVKAKVDNLELFTDALKSVFAFYSPHILTSSNNLFLKLEEVEKDVSQFNAQIVQFGEEKIVAESKATQLHRVKTMKNVINLYTHIDIDNLMKMLDFDSPVILQQWLIDNFSSSSFTIQENELIFQTEDTDISAAIDSLLGQYDQWGKEGKAKKK